MVNTPGEVAMETELHWPQMKASEGLDFDCTSIFNHRLFKCEIFHQPSMTAYAEIALRFTGTRHKSN